VHGATCSVTFNIPFRLFPFNIAFHAVTKTVTVKYQDNEVPFINELEYIDGEVWANVWEIRCLLSSLGRQFLMQYLNLAWLLLFIIVWLLLLIS
jgi:hypothetical protein